MSMASGAAEHEFVVADDGSIPAEQIACIGVRPGTHLRVATEHPNESAGSIARRLKNWPDVRWERLRASQSHGSGRSRQVLTTVALT
jgi:hypothetical protein